jgi:hypothetical protein
MRITERIKYLIDKVVLAHACSSEIWIYYAIIVFVLFVKAAGGLA